MAAPRAGSTASGWAALAGSRAGSASRTAGLAGRRRDRHRVRCSTPSSRSTTTTTSTRDPRTRRAAARGCRAHLALVLSGCGSIGAVTRCAGDPIRDGRQTPLRSRADLQLVHRATPRSRSRSTGVRRRDGCAGSRGCSPRTSGSCSVELRRRCSATPTRGASASARRTAHATESTIYPRHGLRRARGSAAPLYRRAGAAHRSRAGYRHLDRRDRAAERAVGDWLHERLGFAKAGHLARIGRKFERWIDVGELAARRAAD